MPSDTRIPANWQTVSGPRNGLYAGTNSAGNQTLMQWGILQFQVWPLNFHEMDHETSSDWAHKEIAGAPIYREWVGENDEIRHLRGKLFPYRIGGMTSIDMFEGLRRGGIAQMMVRGDGMVLGWFVCEKLVRNHTFMSTEGVGKQISFEAVFARVPVPASDMAYNSTWQLGGGEVGALAQGVIP
jgi:phage protein U